MDGLCEFGLSRVPSIPLLRMPLSRHFYPLDDVAIALLDSSRQTKPTETLFWCQELLWSGCHAEAISSLFESWIWHVGPFRLRWLLDASNTLATEEVTEESIQCSAYQLSTLAPSQHDHSLWVLLSTFPNGCSSPPESLTRKTPPSLPSEDDADIFLVRALFQGKARCAWWMASCGVLSSDRIWCLLEWYITHLLPQNKDDFLVCLHTLRHYESLLGSSSEEYDRVVLCVALCMCCLSSTQRQDSLRPMISSLDARHQSLLQEWNTKKGTKSARVFSLPRSCLYGRTSRGMSRWSQQNTVQLHHVEKYIVGCPFWDEALAEYATIEKSGTLTWMSDNHREAFYERYFPDNIPDEWSREDKERSHGGGIVGPTESISLWKYASPFLSQPCRLAWHAPLPSREVLHTRTLLPLHPCQLLCPLVTSNIHPPSLQPVHRIKHL